MLTGGTPSRQHLLLMQPRGGRRCTVPGQAFLAQVLTPRIEYAGQLPIRAVASGTMPIQPQGEAATPGNKPSAQAMSPAPTMMRSTRSTVPMLVVMTISM